LRLADGSGEEVAAKHEAPEMVVKI
jgi:hypothetical protein